jgi:hypothetical protein
MHPLRELQRDFRRALLAGDEAALAPFVREDGLAAAERIAVYRNNVVSSLTEVLKDAFPAACRLVGERFFAYAAHEFLGAHPPSRPCLAEYGADFPGFLAAFPPCRKLVYLADAARLEWLMHSAAHAPEAEPIEPAALGAVAPEDTPRIVLRLHPSLGLLESPWPIERIWRANRSGCADEADGGGIIDLGSGGVRLEIARAGGDVVFRPLDASAFAFRRALLAGDSLGAAAEAGLTEDAGFDLAGALADLFRQRLVTGFALGPAPAPAHGNEETSP